VAERILMPVRLLTWIGPTNHQLDEVQIPVHMGNSVPNSQRDLADSTGMVRIGVDADWGVLDGVHIGATWRLQLNCPCVDAMWPCVLLL